MNKSLIRQQILERLNDELNAARAALQSAHEAATHEDSVAENKYDTFGLEAAYLAHGQAVRVQEIEQAIAAYRNLPLAEASPDGAVRLGMLVTLESATGTQKRVFLGPDGAGVKVSENGREIVVITPRSPLGQSLLGKQEGDEVVIEANGAKQMFEILDVG